MLLQYIHDITYYHADPVLGALAAAALSYAVGAISKGIQNRYNSPKQQLKRLRKAGLPLSYMYEGNVNQQSDSVDFSIDPDFGVVEQQQLKETHRLNDEQIKKITEEIENLETTGDILGSQRNVQVHKEEYLLSHELGKWNKDKTHYYTPQELRLKVETGVMQADRFFKQNAGEIKNIEKQFTAAQNKADLLKIGQQISNMISQKKLMNQLHDIRGVEQLVNDTITAQLEKGGDVSTILYTILVKLFSKL